VCQSVCLCVWVYRACSDQIYYRIYYKNLLQRKVDERTVYGSVWHSVAVCHSVLKRVRVYVCVCGCKARVLTKFTTNFTTMYGG